MIGSARFPLGIPECLKHNGKTCVLYKERTVLCVKCWHQWKWSFAAKCVPSVVMYSSWFSTSELKLKIAD